MDFPRFRSMQAYWDDHPPVHLVVAAYVGYKPKRVDAPGAIQPMPASHDAGGIFDDLTAMPSPSES